jgi:hypothetical protein
MSTDWKVSPSPSWWVSLSFVFLRIIAWNQSTYHSLCLRSTIVCPLSWILWFIDFLLWLLYFIVVGWIFALIRLCQKNPATKVLWIVFNLFRSWTTFFCPMPLLTLECSSPSMIPKVASTTAGVATTSKIIKPCLRDLLRWGHSIFSCTDDHFAVPQVNSCIINFLWRVSTPHGSALHPLSRHIKTISETRESHIRWCIAYSWTHCTPSQLLRKSNVSWHMEEVRNRQVWEESFWKLEMENLRRGPSSFISRWEQHDLVTDRMAQL